MIKIWVHSNIARLAENRAEWQFEPTGEQIRLGDLLKTVFADQRKLFFGIVDETGSVRKHINIFIGSLNINQAAGLHSSISDGDEISIFTAVSGG